MKRSSYSYKIERTVPRRSAFHDLPKKEDESADRKPSKGATHWSVAGRATIKIKKYSSYIQWGGFTRAFPLKGLVGKPTESDSGPFTPTPWWFIVGPAAFAIYSERENAPVARVI